MGVRGVVRGAVESVLVRLPRTTRPGDRLILAYHNVVPNDWTPRGDRSLHLPLHKFEAQLRMIRDETEIVPLLELLTTEARSDRRVAITFDDAYASSLQLGVGACVAADAPCTVFVSPGLLDAVPPWDRLADAGEWTEAGRQEFLWKRQGRETGQGGAHTVGRGNERADGGGRTLDDALRVASLREVHSVIASHGDLVTLGNHTMTHANLGALTAGEARAELDEASAWLREHLDGSLVPVTAYPYGHSPVHAAEAVSPDTARFGLLVSGGWFSSSVQHEPLAIPRWNVPAGISLNGFRVRLRGRLRGR